MATDTRVLPETAVCLQCGYSLRGLPGNVCPECGGGFDPFDSRTWGDAKRLSLLAKLAHEELGIGKVFLPCAPRRRDLLAVTCATLLVGLGLGVSWIRVSPWLYLCVGMLLLGSTVYLAAATVLWLIKDLHKIMGCPLETCPTQGKRARRWSRWICMVCIWITLAGLCLVPQLFNVGRLWLSRSAFHRKAEAVSPAVEGRQWVGLVRVDLIRRPNPNSVIFDIDWDRRVGLFSVHFSRRFPAGSRPGFLGPGWRAWGW